MYLDIIEFQFFNRVSWSACYLSLPFVWECTKWISSCVDVSQNRFKRAKRYMYVHHVSREFHCLKATVKSPSLPNGYGDDSAGWHGCICGTGSTRPAALRAILRLTYALQHFYDHAYEYHRPSLRRRRIGEMGVHIFDYIYACILSLRGLLLPKYLEEVGTL